MRNLRMILRAGVMLAFFILSGATWGATVLPVIPNQHLRGSLGVDGATSLTTLQVSGATTLTALVVDGETTLTTLTVMGVRYPTADGAAGQAIVTDGAGKAGWDYPTSSSVGLHSMKDVTAHSAGHEKLFYSDISGHIQELNWGYIADGYFLKTQGSGSPAWSFLSDGDIPETIARGDDVDTSIAAHAAHNDAHHKPVSLAGYNYLTIGGTGGQVVTAGQIALASQVSGTLPDGNVSDTLTIGSGSTINADSINAGTLSTGRFSGYNDLVAESKVGTGSTQVSAGNHAHGGVYEPVINAGTTGQYWRWDKSWATLDFTALAGSATDAQVPNVLTIDSGSVVDGGAIKAGTVGTHYFSAWDDLTTEGKIGGSEGQLALGNHVHDRFETGDYLDQFDVTNQTMVGSVTFPSITVEEGIAVGAAQYPAAGQIYIKHATGTPRVTTAYLGAGAILSKGPVLPANVSDAPIYWTSESAIESDSDGDASATGSGASTLDTVNGQGMAFTIPEGATFTGVEIKLRAKATGTHPDWCSVFPRITHASYGLSYWQEAALSGTFQTFTIGGSTELLGCTQEDLDLYCRTAATFGVSFYAGIGGTNEVIYVDWVTLKIYYTIASSEMPWSAGTDASGNYVVGVGDDLTTPALTFARTTRNATFTGTINTTGGVFEDTDAEDLVLRTNSQENQLVLNSTGGYVGIGTAAPSYALTVAGLIYATAGVYSATINYAPSVYATGTFVSTIPTVTYRSTAILGAMGLRNGAQAVNAGYNCVGLYSAPAFTEAGSDKHKLLAGAGFFIPTITNAGATVSHTANVYIEGAPSATGAAGNYALWVDAGNVRIDEDVLTSGSIKLATDGSGTLDINGTTRLDASGNATLGTVASGAVTITGAAGSPTTPANPLEISTAKDAGVDVNPSLKYYQADVTTADATVTTILTIPIPQYSVCTIQVTINGVWATDASKGAGYIGAATYTNQAGTATPIGTATAIAGHESDAAHDYTFAFSSGNALVRVTGKAATSMKWSATATRHIVGNGAAD